MWENKGPPNQIIHRLSPLRMDLLFRSRAGTGQGFLEKKEEWGRTRWAYFPPAAKHSPKDKDIYTPK